MITQSNKEEVEQCLLKEMEEAARMPAWKLKRQQGEEVSYDDVNNFLRFSFKQNFRMDKKELEFFESPKMLGDVFESLLGAVFIDGGFEAVVKVYEPLFAPFIVFIAQNSKTLPKEPKEDLLLICASQLKKTPKLVCPSEKEQVDLNQLLEQTYGKGSQFSVDAIKQIEQIQAESTQKFEQLFKC